MSRHRIGSGLSLLLLLAAPVAARAQGNGNGFLLGTPVGSITFRAGYDHANAGSDMFTDPSTIGQLTLSKSDFSGFSGAVDLGVRISDRFDFVLGTAYSGSSASSRYRHYLDNNDAPIEQTTSFQRVPISGSLKMYLAPRGRSIGKFAWVPSRFSPYIGGGGGMYWYRFRQSGDFIDFATADQNVYTATTQSSAWTTEAHAFAGLDYSLSPRLALTAETRYTWGRGPVSSDYVGFHRIDLSGIAATAGLTVRF
jgi:hypothetical protein